MAIDLFAGGGGLTVGLKRAKFAVAAAVEIDQHAYATYKSNHPEVLAYKQDIRTVSGVSLLKTIVGRRIDLIAGCPPCQGFTSLTSKYTKADPRNDLIREMGRIVRETLPRAVMMENVPGLAHRGAALLDEFIEDLVELGYHVTYGVLQVADYGTPQYRRRLVLLAGKDFSIPLPPPTHSRTGDNGLLCWNTVRDTIAGLATPECFVDVGIKTGARVSAWHLVRKLSPENQERIKRAKAGKGWQEIPERYRPKCHKGTYRGFQNVYGRMAWDDVSPTITAGCTTLSKGRFGHPKANRTLSVREAALLQEFPDSYRIETPYMEYACHIIGNALPCGFATAMARHVAKAIKKEKEIGARQR